MAKEDDMLVADIKKNLSFLDNAVISKEVRLISRVLRTIGTTRRRMTADVLRNIIEFSFATEETASKKNQLLSILDTISPGSDKMVATDTSSNDATRLKGKCHPEIQAYVHLLVVIYLIDKNHIDQVSTNIRPIMMTYNDVGYNLLFLIGENVVRI
jgi:26S proteasome regulatory subunit N3